MDKEIEKLDIGYEHHLDRLVNSDAEPLRFKIIFNPKIVKRFDTAREAYELEMELQPTAPKGYFYSSCLEGGSGKYLVMLIQKEEFK